MKIVTQYEFDDEDRRLLSIILPDDPCVKCYLNGNGCCGCSDGVKYEEIVKPYKERNIYDLALKFKRMDNLKKEIVNMQEEINKLAKEIEETGLLK